jgi:hypothetical protein
MYRLHSTPSLGILWISLLPFNFAICLLFRKHAKSPGHPKSPNHPKQLDIMLALKSEAINLYREINLNDVPRNEPKRPENTTIPNWDIW